MIVQNSRSDALSAVLNTINAVALCSISLEAGGQWGIRFPAPANIKFNVVRRGTCWLLTEGSEPVRLEAGDCFVVANGRFDLASSPCEKLTSARDVFSVPSLSARLGDGRDFAILGGSVRLDTVDGVVLSDALPQILTIKGGSAAPIAWLLDQLDKEWDSGAPGAQLVCNDLLRLAFIHVIRAHLAQRDAGNAGWLGGLTDRHIAPVLRAVHSAPQRDWTLTELSSIAGQSRSSFAARFKQRVGLAPLDYLARWRMRLAAGRLRRGDEPVASIGASLGYRSDSAFGASFRRVYGISPARYRSEFKAGGPRDPHIRVPPLEARHEVAAELNPAYRTGA
ncbi:AraC family transcriptional regulator [Rhizobium sp. Root1220]|uniref:AraC family transcriptional regulator n=1 Tax=Rhizobium sp. Root1220 TaxID=1736432 RepID=UPI0009EA747D|nr:AraC family transcriptional regulator [Rhizobium sp. Root1220]